MTMASFSLEAKGGHDMTLISLRSRSHVEASIFLTRADHLFIHNYIRSLLNNILRPIL